jgi:hypothetical protein
MPDGQQVRERSDSEPKEENLLKKIWNARSDHSESVSAEVFFVIILIGMSRLRRPFIITGDSGELPLLLPRKTVHPSHLNTSLLQIMHR